MMWHCLLLLFVLNANASVLYGGAFGYFYRIDTDSGECIEIPTEHRYNSMAIETLATLDETNQIYYHSPSQGRPGRASGAPYIYAYDFKNMKELDTFTIDGIPEVRGMQWYANTSEVIFRGDRTLVSYPSLTVRNYKTAPTESEQDAIDSIGGRYFIVTRKMEFYNYFNNPIPYDSPLRVFPFMLTTVSLSSNEARSVDFNCSGNVYSFKSLAYNPNTNKLEGSVDNFSWSNHDSYIVEIDPETAECYYLSSPSKLTYHNMAFDAQSNSWFAVPLNEGQVYSYSLDTSLLTSTNAKNCQASHVVVSQTANSEDLPEYTGPRYNKNAEIFWEIWNIIAWVINLIIL